MQQILPHPTSESVADVWESPPQPATNSAGNSTATINSSFQPLFPRPWWGWRRLLAALCCTGLLFTQWPGLLKLSLVVVVLFLFGTGIEVELSDRELRRTSSCLFLRTRQRRWELASLKRSEAEWVEDSGLGEAFLLGLYGLVAPLLDWFCPWSGGNYRVWIVRNSGRRTLLWQGHRQAPFQRRVDLLKQRVPLPMIRI